MFTKVSPEPLSSLSPNQTPTPKPKGSKLFLSLLLSVSFLIQLALAALAFYSFIYAIIESNRAADEKVTGEFEVVEMHYNDGNGKRKGYFVANTLGNLSRVNGTYDIDEYSLSTSALRLCYLYSNDTLVRDTAITLKDSQAMNSVKLVLAFLIILDLFDALKGLFYRLKPYILKLLTSKFFSKYLQYLRIACFIPKSKGVNAAMTRGDKLTLKIFMILIVASPRYLSLHFTSEDYSRCVGFTENDPFLKIFSSFFYPSPNANTIQTWDTDTSDVGFQIYMVYVGIFFGNLAVVSFLPYFPNDPWHKKMVQVCMLVGCLLCLFGLGYFVFNYWLLAAQIKQSAEVILSLVYIGRDGLNVILASSFEYFEQKWQDLQETFAQASLATVLDKGKDLIMDKINEQAKGGNDVLKNDLEFIGDHVDKKIEVEQSKQDQEEAINTAQKNATTNPGEEFNKLIE